MRQFVVMECCPGHCGPVLAAAIRSVSADGGGDVARAPAMRGGRTPDLRACMCMGIGTHCSLHRHAQVCIELWVCTQAAAVSVKSPDTGG